MTLITDWPTGHPDEALSQWAVAGQMPSDVVPSLVEVLRSGARASADLPSRLRKDPQAGCVATVYCDARCCLIEVDIGAHDPARPRTPLWRVCVAGDWGSLDGVWGGREVGEWADAMAQVAQPRRRARKRS